VIADRSEYRVDIDDAVMQLRNLSAGRLDELHSSIPDIFPAGVEIAAFAIDAS